MFSHKKGKLKTCFHIKKENVKHVSIQKRRTQNMFSYKKRKLKTCFHVRKENSNHGSTQKFRGKRE